MKKLAVMIKPVSSLCDMRCSYCFYADVAASRHKASHGLMSRETAYAVIRHCMEVLIPGDQITFAFQGGEPTLAGLDFYAFFVEAVQQTAAPGVVVDYAIQTNGLSINEEWCLFFKHNRFLVGLSLDGDADLHNRNRLDAEGKGTYSRVRRARELLEKYGTAYNILCVLTAENARHAGKIWRFILKEKMQYIQFIPCLEPFENTQPDYTSLTSERFYRFYSELFPLWRREAEDGHFVSVRLFEDLIGLFLAGKTITCGASGHCTPQIVVEADGGVYPCDFYVLDQYRLSDLTRHTLREAFDAVVASGFLQALPPAKKCVECHYNSWCRGGCKRMAHAVYGDECGMKRFMDACMTDLLAIGRKWLLAGDAYGDIKGYSKRKRHIADASVTSIKRLR